MSEAQPSGAGAAQRLGVGRRFSGADGSAGDSPRSTSHRPLWCQCSASLQSGRSMIGIEADAVHAGRRRREPARLRGDVVEPVARGRCRRGWSRRRRAARAVALPRPCAAATRTARGAGRRRCHSRRRPVVHLPLAVVVVVDADEIERRGASRRARGRACRAACPTPATASRRPRARIGECGASARRHDVDQRLDVQEARARILGADRVDRRAAPRAPAGT